MQTQMTTIGNCKEFISLEQLAALRSVMQTEKAPSTSGKYRFYRTMDVIDALRDHNWFPVKAQEQRVIAKYEGRLGYQKHMIRFRQSGVALQVIGDLLPELILTNAHDGSTRYSIMAGFFRMVCINGLVVSEAGFGRINVKHIGHDAEDVIEASYRVTEDVPRLTEKIGDYRNIELEPVEQAVFGESALLMKYNDDGKLPVVKDPVYSDLLHIGDRAFSLYQLLLPRRVQDEAPTLWNTFNRVQEKMTKGGHFENTIRYSPGGKEIRKNKIPSIVSINENLRVNRGLWHLMEEMAKVKIGARA